MEREASGHVRSLLPKGSTKHPCLGSKLIYACPCKLMEPIVFWEALWDPISTGSSLEKLLEAWNSCLPKTINKIVPQCHFHPSAKPPPWYNPELQRKKWELRESMVAWSTRVSCRSFMKTYEIVMKATKMDFYATSIASRSSCPGQLFILIK